MLLSFSDTNAHPEARECLVNLSLRATNFCVATSNPNQDYDEVVVEEDTESRMDIETNQNDEDDADEL